MTEDQISEILIGIFLKVHKILGPGLLESVYESAICYELEKLGLKFSRQTYIDIIYEELYIQSGFRADIIVEEKVIVELKSIELLTTLNSKQLLTYLKLSGLKLGLLVNFNVSLIKEGIIRLVNGL